MNPTLGVISFPGNNCEVESLRAAARNGFETQLILWHETDKIGKCDAYFLVGGFSYEDRGRSGALAAREKIFEALRREAARGKVILGVCNGAQMVVESGLIPIGANPSPFALAENVRRDSTGKVLGTGFYNVWIFIAADRADTAFSSRAKGVLRLPMAHGEGRFTTIDSDAREALQSGKNVAFRYCDEAGKISDAFPTTPNGALFATAMIVNDEGTVGAIMPHPERFFDAFDGDQIFASMRDWIVSKKSPAVVCIGDFESMIFTFPQKFEPQKNATLWEKKLIITDNESFSLSQTASAVAEESVHFEKTTIFEIAASNGESLEPRTQKLIAESGLLFNPNKELLLQEPKKSAQKFIVIPYEDDQAVWLEEKLQPLLSQKIKMRILKAWDFGSAKKESVEKILRNRLLANPNSAEIFSAN